MAQFLSQVQGTAIEKDGSVIVDIDGLVQSSERCSGSPKMTKALSRKISNRTERRNIEEGEVEDGCKRVLAKVICSQVDHSINQPMIPSKILPGPTTAILTELGEGKSKRFNRLTGIHPRKILLIFATMSSMGTMILIYFTLAINRRGGL